MRELIVEQKKHLTREGAFEISKPNSHGLIDLVIRDLPGVARDPVTVPQFPDGGNGLSDVLRDHRIRKSAEKRSDLVAPVREFAEFVSDPHHMEGIANASVGLC